MLSRALLLFVALAVSLSVSSQIQIQGRLLETVDKTPVPYANIGIVNSSIGTISNADGTFELTVPVKHLNDTLLIAALGFDRKSFLVSSLESPTTIYLTETVTVLQNIIVKSKKIRPANSAELGNRYFNTSSIYTDSIAAGSAMALLIENRPPNYFPDLRLPYYVTRARLRISHNAFDKFRVRIRFLSLDSITGLPDRDLVNESIIATSSINRGWLDVNLTKHNIVITQPRFFLVFEWIVEEEDRLMIREQHAEFKRQFPNRVTTDTVIVGGEKITVNSWHGLRAGTSFGSSSLRQQQDQFKCYFRNNSYGRWNRSSFILAATVTISNYSSLPR